MACGSFGRLWSGLKGIFLSPLYLVLASIMGAPGIEFHLRIAAIGVRLLVLGRASLKTCTALIFSPMDSTRYFEFQEVWKSARGRPFSRYLDVSSPRLIPLLLVQATPGATAEFINPDASDLRGTRELANALGLNSRCRFFNGVIDCAAYAPASFDLVTCISVLEHIPEDTAAVRSMWALLRPGGKLVLTLPCMASSLEQHISHNQYGVLKPGDDGYTFWQRYYDQERLESCVFCVTGKPAYVSVYGEKSRGFFFRSATMKRLLGSRYPFWREPYMMATEYGLFACTDELPGEGVVMLEFIKPGVTSGKGMGR